MAMASIEIELQSVRATPSFAVDSSIAAAAAQVNNVSSLTKNIYNNPAKEGRCAACKEITTWCLTDESARYIWLCPIQDARHFEFY